MSMVAATVDTGIYSPPGPDARPRPGSVSSFPRATATETAGLRACPRCPPSRVARQVAGRAPNVVCQGVRLIVAGALDGGTEHELGARLGLSARHLRRLFLAYLGATPDQLARLHRVHSACRLLDDTDLSVTEIASAAGYGSLRQLNRSFWQAFRASPSQLRTQQRSRGRLAAGEGLPLRLRYHGQLDWAALLRCLAAQAIPGVEHVSMNGYRRTVLVGGDPGVLELRPGEPGHLVLVAHLPHWEGLIHVVGGARQIASLDADPDTPARFLASDPLIGPLITARPGVRVPGCWDPFEVGVRAIIAQHEPAAAISTQRLVGRLGKHLPELGPFSLTHCFPPAETIAAIGPAELAAIGLGRAAATAIATFAAAVASGQLEFHGSPGLGQLITSLTATGGLDSRCARYVALRAGQQDAFSAPVPATTHPATTPGPVGAQSRTWQPWRALAATHLWLEAQRPRG
jgi:AraC family transcriptional regulator, regulatory protein of adaptative response / DNA-3-methyladenine glycosylase II